ncbi:MAG: hypothetical protein WBD17_06675, partial [Candidatus Omnitrophota bacterium]
EKTRVETGTRFKLMLVKKEEITPAVKTVRHPYSDERHVSPDEFRAQAVMAIRSVLQTEKVVDRLAQVMIDLAESAEEAGREEKEKIVLALDLELGEKDVSKLFAELAKILPHIKKNNDELSLFLNNLEIIPGKGKSLADRVEGISSEGGKGKVRPENIIVVTTGANAAFYKDMDSSTVVGVDNKTFPAEAYMPLLEIMLFAITKHLASARPGECEDELLKYYKLIPNVILASHLMNDEYEDLFINKDAKVFIIRLIPDAVPLSGEIEELRESLMVALKRA